MGWAKRAECPALATKYTGMLIKDFGSNGTIDRHQFFKAFIVVKGETTGHNEEIAMIDEAFNHIDMLTAIDEAFEHVDMLTAIDEAFEHVDMLTAIDEAFEHVDELNKHHEHHRHHEHHGHKDAATALVSAGTNLDDAFGCPGSDWGNTAEEHAEANCIFNKLSHGQDELSYKEVHHALEHDCVYMHIARDTECPALATKYAGMLIQDFGSNGTIDRHQFYKAFVVVKGETTGHNNQISTSTCLTVAGGLTAIAGAGYLLKSKMSFNKSSVEESLL